VSTTATPEPRLLTLDEAARRLRVSKATVWRRVRDGSIPAVQLGGRRAPLRIDERELEAWVYGPPQEAA
jgi:excisionase family DNA binding protein